MACDAPRSAAIKENLLLEAHPPIIIPYTPILTTPKMYKIPILISAICKSILRSKISIWLLQGITEQVISAAVMARPGPNTNNALLELVGIISSFMMSFNPSAKGWSSPKGPALLGPGRSCNTAATFLSAKVVYNAIPKLANTMIAISTNFSMIKSQSTASSVMS